MKILTTLLLCGLLAATPIHAQRIVKNPETLGSANITGGGLKAREVVYADTATTIRFTLDYPAGRNFRICSTSYLIDADNHRYPLRSAEGLPLDTWQTSPADKTTHFTLHFSPLPKNTRVFDFIEYDGRGAFMLFGIHDKKHKLRITTMEEQAKANPYTTPDDWFTTDSVTLRGHIEGYNREAGHPTQFDFSYDGLFDKDDMKLVVDIQPDGTFEKRWKADYPMMLTLSLDKDLPGMSTFKLFARPGETLDVTLRQDQDGQFRCHYHNGSSKAVERLLHSNLRFAGMSSRMYYCEGTPHEAEVLAEQIWQLMLYRLQTVAARENFTPMETQLAMSDAQVCFATGVMDYALNKMFSQDTTPTAADTLERDTLTHAEFYTRLLRRIDFDNPMLIASEAYNILINRLQYSWPVNVTTDKLRINILDDSQQEFTANEKAAIDNTYTTLQAMTGQQKNTLTAQLCAYRNMLNYYDLWSRQGDPSLLPYSIASLTHQSIHRHAEDYHAHRQTRSEPATPLPQGQPAQLIHTLQARYPGRYLLIDFWMMACGPCRGAIQHSKELRAEIAKRDDVKLVFIVGEMTAQGSEAYHKYVQEWLADEETICLPITEFRHLQEYFRFNAIPHYETITPDGRLVNEKYRINGFHNFNADMEWLKKAME